MMIMTINDATADHWRRQQWGTGARAPVHQFGNFYLHLSRVGSGRLIVRMTHIFQFQPQLRNRCCTNNQHGIYRQLNRNDWD